MVSGDSGSSAAGRTSEGVLRAVLASLLPAAGVFAGIVIGWYTITWAVQTRGRLLIGSVIVGFSAVVVLVALLWVSVEVGGFSPS